MTNRTSTHFFILVLIVILTAAAHYSIYYGAMIRGYETSEISAIRNLALVAVSNPAEPRNRREIRQRCIREDRHVEHDSVGAPVLWDIGDAV